jgi:hypothetical protein
MKFNSMKKISCLIPILLLGHLASYGQKTIFPFEEVLKKMDTLVFIGSPTNNKGFKYDTLFANNILKLRQLSFTDRKVQIEKYGVTPNGSISFYKDGKRMILIGCWDLNENEYGVNISINEKFTYHGLTIAKKSFGNLFKKE